MCWCGSKSQRVLLQARVEGLGEGQQPYLDNLEGRARKESAGPLSFDQEVDRIYLSASPDIAVHLLPAPTPQ